MGLGTGDPTAERNIKRARISSQGRDQGRQIAILIPLLLTQLEHQTIRTFHKMRPTLALSLVLAAAQVATAQYFIDYFRSSGCSGTRKSCSNIAAGVCCTLNEWTNQWPSAKTGSWGALGFTVWTQTTGFGDVCRRCRTTSSFGCWSNNAPFDLAFIVGISPVCNAGVLRRATIDTASGNTTELVAGDDRELAEGCTSHALPDVLGIDGQDYAITDKNRKEIEEDLEGAIEGTKKVDFAQKWKSALLGPTNVLRQARAGEVAKDKPAAA